MSDIGKAAAALLDSIYESASPPPEGWVSAAMAAKHWNVDNNTASGFLMRSGLQRRKCKSPGDVKAVYYYGPEPSQTNRQAHKAPSKRPSSPTHDTKCRASKR